MLLWLLGVVLGKIAYDAYCNELQKGYDASTSLTLRLYNDENLPVALWEKIGKDCWIESQRAR
jgi:hypothetical protein